MQFLALRDSYAFVILTKRAVQAGEQLFIDYGKEHFKGEPGGCPCSSCQVLQSHPSPGAAPESSKRKHQPTDEETRLNKEAKRLKNRDNRKKGRVLGCE